MDEEVLLRAYRAGPHGRAIDVRLTFNALEPISISGREAGNKGYGGFSLRFGPREETVITTAQGVQSADSDHHRSPWADESGWFRGADAVSGIAIFQHPSNPGFPAAWTLRHYGFLGPAWPGLDVQALEPGAPLTLRFRIWVHEGDAVAGRVEEAYRAFAQAPVIQLER